MTATLPLFYFKPTICCIDDDKVFLESLTIFLKDRYKCLSFNDTSEAMTFFNAYSSPLSGINLKRDFTESDMFGVKDHVPVDINIPLIRNMANLNNLEQEIAVLIIDYNMPNSNGLEICEALSHLPIKKILLTGEASYEKGIEAFNKGLIDKFIKKDVKVANKIQDYIDELIYQYFCEKSADITSHLEASKSSLLSDSHFIKFFNDWRHNNKINEFYLLNKHGGFLIKDQNEAESYFVVMSESDVHEFIRMNDELFEESPELLGEVSQGKKIPFFGLGKESWDVDTNNWQTFFYPSQIISGRENYHWAIVKKNN